jgi:flagellar protein FliT
MSVVQEVYQLSKEFYDLISNPVLKKDRDSLILKINELLFKRETLLKEMNGPYSLEEQQMGKQIMEYDQKIQDKLKSIKLEIQKDFLIAKNQKRNTPKYMAPYPTTNDGIFYDKRN